MKCKEYIKSIFDLLRKGQKNTVYPFEFVLQFKKSENIVIN